MNIILLGAPGSGKGTEASLISKDLSIPTISTGDIIRDNIKNKTELGILSQNYINLGQLVPDDLVINLVKERLTKTDVLNGYILDGFPRTVTQAQALQSFSKIDKVILIDTNYDVIEERILSRRTCPVCKRVYNTKTYKSDFCEVCKAKLIIRDDDNKETVKNRYDVYLKETAPLIDFYKNQGLLYKVNGNLQADEVYKEIKQILQKWR